MLRFEVDTGLNQDNDSLQNWELDGWIGTDENKLWVKSEGEGEGNALKSAEFWALYSRSLSIFWDLQAGIRFDTKPDARSYLTLGVNGLAPYWFETEAHMFISDSGDITARLHQENEFLLTQKLVIQPYAEVALSAQPVQEIGIGKGITDGKVGIKTRYEFTRKFAPYLDLHYSQKFGDTASIAQRHDEDKNEFAASIGLMLLF